MNGNDRFLNVNDAHLRVTGGNVHASSFNLDQISITTTSTTASTIDFLNEAKAFNARSNIEVGTANLFVDTTTSNVGIRTSSPEYALDVHGPANVSVLTANTVTGFDGTLFLGSHLLPTQHQQFDIGSAEKKIRHLFLSDNSLWIGDESKISVVGGKMKFLKRDKNIVPSGTEALGGNAAGALAHAQNSDSSLNNINQMKLEHWLAYTKSLTGGADKDIKDIFTDATANYEATSASDAFKEHGNDIYSVNKLRLGDAAAAGATLDVVGTIKVTQSLTVSDASSTSILGQAAIGWNGANGDSSMACFAQKDNNTGAKFALKQSSGGVTFINAPSNKSIRFQIAGQEKARFDTNGQLGIGTTSPGNLLHVYKANNDETSGILIEKAHGGLGTAASLFFGVASTTESTYAGIPKAAIFYERNLANGRGDIKFCNDAVDDTNPVSTAASDTRMIIKNNGNVGVGTVVPNEKLHVNGNIRLGGPEGTDEDASYHIKSAGQIHINAATDGAADDSYICLDLRAGQTGSNRSGIGICGAATNTSYQFISFETADSERMIIKEDGDVGINTSTPGRKLEVYTGNGSVPGIRLRRYPTGATYTDFHHADSTSPANSKEGLAIITSDGNATTQEVMRICGANLPGNSGGGTVGIGTTSPSWPLEIVSGNNSITHYGPNTTWSGVLRVGAADDKTAQYDTATAQCISTNGNLHLDAADTRDIYLCHYRGSNVQFGSTVIHSSDDRLKSEEELITNATDTLLKLSPQKYKKAYTLREDESREPFIEAGLMAQDVWYDAPELRHLVHLGSDANPTDTKPEAPVEGDIRQDPDYSSWGTEAAALNYDGLIAYLIKSNQELHARIHALENAS